MQKRSPRQHSVLSWAILGAGAVLALIGAITTREYQINGWLILGGLVILGGIAWHLMMVRCPACGHSLAGYRPLPEVCPNCHTKF